MSLGLLDWRRSVTALYGRVRAEPDPAEAHALWRAGRDELFRSHPQSPLPTAERATFAGLPVAAYDVRWRFEVGLDTDVAPERREVVTATDGVVPFDRLGTARLPGVGDLDVWWLGSYGGGLFLPVRDGLRGTHTYGGGRYVLDSVKGADLGGDVRPDGTGTLVVDLNFAYNPSCAYDPAWACPLPGPGNTVATGLPVGELTAPEVSS